MASRHQNRPPNDYEVSSVHPEGHTEYGSDLSPTTAFASTEHEAQATAARTPGRRRQGNSRALPAMVG